MWAPPGAILAPQRSSETYLGLLQQTTAAGNDLRAALAKVAESPGDTLALARLEESAPRITLQAAGYLAQASNLLLDASLRRWWGDVLTHLENLWAGITDEYKRLRTSAGDVLKVKAAAEQMIVLIDDASYKACWITIPPRLGDHLNNIAVGETFDFAATFSDELPNPALRKKLFQDLANATLLIAGYCDPATEKITRVSPSKHRQILSIVVALIVATVCAGALVIFNAWGSATGLAKPEDRLPLSTVLLDVCIVWAGTLAHFSLSWYKGFRNDGAHVPRSATRVLYWINSKELAIWVAVVVGMVLTGFFALTGRVTEPVALFAIGYSADSLADTLFPRFDAHLVKLAKVLPGPAA